MSVFAGENRTLRLAGAAEHTINKSGRGIATTMHPTLTSNAVSEHPMLKQSDTEILTFRQAL